MPTPSELITILQELNKLIAGLQAIGFKNDGLDLPTLLGLFRPKA